MADARPTVGAMRVFVVGSFLVGMYLVYVTAAELVNMRRLEANSQVVDARVVDTRVLSSTRRGDQLQVRYTFEVDGQTYVYGDPAGRDDRWATLPADTYERARTEGTIPVRYEPATPSNNHAVDELDRSSLNRIIGFIVGVFCLVPGLLSLVGLVLTRAATRDESPST